jgi:hypothetical protein
LTREQAPRLGGQFLELNVDSEQSPTGSYPRDTTAGVGEMIAVQKELQREKLSDRKRIRRF